MLLNVKKLRDIVYGQLFLRAMRQRVMQPKLPASLVRGVGQGL